MKKTLFTLCTMLAFGLIANPYEFVNEEGRSYIQINEDLSDFNFKADFKSVGNSGSICYYLYDGNNYTYRGQFSKSNGSDVSLGNWNNGDKIGFYLMRKNGSIIDSYKFVNNGGTTYLEFIKNGHGQDEKIIFDDIKVTYVRRDDAPTGMPLPGFIPTFVISLFMFPILFWYLGMRKLG